VAGDAAVVSEAGPVVDRFAPSAVTSSFVGRRHEVAAVTGLLARSALVTLWGPGGVGKTRLALEVARQARAAGTPVRVLPLGGRRGPSAVARGLCDVGVDVRGGSPAEALVRDIDGVGGILVLDECESELEQVAAFVTELLGSTAEVRVLATSRRPLDVAGEQLYAVPPMATDRPDRTARQADAVQLFLERLAPRRATAATAADARTIEDICRRLDGLPLAIELAARLGQSIGVDGVLARLERGSLIHAPLGPGAPAAKRTIAATIDLSLALLADDARGALPPLAVFAGTFDIDASRSVTQAGSRIERVLNALIDHSLLIETPSIAGHRRFRLLEPTRERAMELLIQSGGLERARERHAGHYRSRSASMSLPAHDERAVLDRLEADFDNLRVALEWLDRHDRPALPDVVARLMPFWIRRGHLGDARRWLDVALACPCERSARLLLAQATLLTQEGRFEEARQAAWLAADAAQRADDPAIEAQAWASFAALTDPDIAPAREDFERAKAAARRTNRAALAEVTAEHAGIEWAVGDDLLAIALAYEVGRLEPEPTTPALIASTILARRALFGQDPDAVPRWRALSETSRSLGDPLLTASCLSFLALALVATANHRAAASAMVEAGELVRRSGSPPARLQHVENAGLLLMRTGRPYLGLMLVMAKERLAGPDWIDSRAYWQYLRTETARALAMVDDDPRAEAATLAPDVAFALAVDAIEEVARTARDRSRSTTTSLSRREASVAELLAAGLTNREIAGRLTISERTVEAHVRHVLDKLGLFNRTQVATWVLAAAQPDLADAAVRDSADGGERSRG
jgi:non-specific serine/threonine protein kinase